MSRFEISAWWTAVVDFLRVYDQYVAVGAGLLGAVIAVRTIRKFVKGREHDEVAANLGVLLFLVVTTEGMWEVVHERLGVNIPLTVAMFAAYDVVIYSQGAAAVKALKADPKARIAGFLLIIWLMSAAGSVTVSFASGNAATWFFRFFSPLVAAALWTQKILARRERDTGGERQESNWIWTPTRLMVRWGWMKPGAADDLTDTMRQRHVAKLVDAALAVHATRPVEGVKQDPKTAEQAAKYARRLQTLAKAADETTVAAARKQLRIALGIQRELLADVDRPADPIDDRTRAALDEIRLGTRETTRRLRAGLPQADPFWSNNVVRIPTGLMDQVQTSPVDHRVDQPAAQEPDQKVDQSADHFGSPKVDQSNPVDQQVNGRSKSRATAPVDDVPPRVLAMVKALRKRYRGEIPGRRTVMPVMGWTNSQDAQAAINLVRAERAERTNDTDRNAV
ncbi:hypothetical protein ACN27G_27520 [Plantactinospora sp. WMMB334]|uniref:hypothetical protein n=1 Tax=Plantactinospora sp. WMMB334 TaxID=3404119 RepID=UPI003B951CFC